MPRGKMRLIHVDVRRAYFHAPSRRDTFITIPVEDQEYGDHLRCGRLNVSMYGTRDAARNWEEHYDRILREAGFLRGAYCPCADYHPEWEFRVVVHGDDFTGLGEERLR